jgi:hypothetical protein
VEIIHEPEYQNCTVKQSMAMSVDMVSLMGGGEFHRISTLDKGLKGLEKK